VRTAVEQGASRAVLTEASEAASLAARTAAWEREVSCKL